MTVVINQHLNQLTRGTHLAGEEQLRDPHLWILTGYIHLFRMKLVYVFGLWDDGMLFWVRSPWQILGCSNRHWGDLTIKNRLAVDLPL